MKILHVSMGLPPFRTGGLNRYCVDLMQQQISDGDKVGLLYPGEYTISQKNHLRKKKHSQFELFRITNPLPLALVNGIAEPERFMTACSDENIYLTFLSEYKPDVIHVHSLQGIHREFFLIAKKLKIRIVFTTHDYYPLCPCCVLLYRDGTLCDANEPDRCAKCNAQRGLSRGQEIAMQSRIYEKLKYSALVKKMRGKQVKATMTPMSDADKETPINGSKYLELRKYYIDIMACMDCIHCNSQVAYKIYNNMYPNAVFETLPITHANLVKRPHNKLSGSTLHLGYVGGLNPYKGLSVLLAALKALDKMGNRNYEVWLYGADYADYCQNDSRFHNGGTYSAVNENAVWSSFDTLVVPSQCYETFGFVVLEALSQGVDVICSDLVGAQQLLPSNCVFTHDCIDSLAKRLCEKRERLILPDQYFSLGIHAKKIKTQIYGY